MPDISLTCVRKPDGTFTAAPRLNVIFVHGLGGEEILVIQHVSVAGTATAEKTLN